MPNLTKQSLELGEESFELERVRCERIFGRESENFRRALSQQLRGATWAWGKSPEERAEALLGTLEAWESFDPRDAAEALLTAHMLGAHNAGMALWQLAALHATEPEARARDINQAIKLADLVQRQIAALDKH